MIAGEILSLQRSDLAAIRGKDGEEAGRLAYRRLAYTDLRHFQDEGYGAPRKGALVW